MRTKFKLTYDWPMYKKKRKKRSAESIFKGWCVPYNLENKNIFCKILMELN